jgi:hypothetical protein
LVLEQRVFGIILVVVLNVEWSVSLPPPNDVPNLQLQLGDIALGGPRESHHHAPDVLGKPLPTGSLSKKILLVVKGSGERIYGRVAEISRLCQKIA